MEEFVIWTLETYGPTGLLGLAVFFEWRRNVRLELQVELIKKAFAKHIDKHVSFESELKHDITKVYDTLNPIAQSVSRIEGYMEAMQKFNGRGKQ